MLDASKLVAENIDRAINQRDPKLSRAEVAARASIGRRTLGHIEAGTTNVQVDTLAALAKVLKVEPWQLLAPNLGLDLLRPVGTATAPDTAVNGSGGKSSALEVKRRLGDLVQSLGDTLPARQKDALIRLIVEWLPVPDDSTAAGSDQPPGFTREQKRILKTHGKIETVEQLKLRNRQLAHASKADARTGTVRGKVRETR